VVHRQHFPPAGGSNTLATSALSVAGATDAWTGTLDINDNDAVVRSTPAAEQADILRMTNLVKSGLNINGVALWTGTGITSSTAAAQAANEPNPLQAVGVILNDDAQINKRIEAVDAVGGGALYGSFSGQPVTADDVLIKFTYFGDADLDGAVTPIDYSLTDTGFNDGLNGWVNGDFDYDGSVTPGDYSLMDTAFAFQGAPLVSGGSAGLTAVPEPASLGLLAIAGAVRLLGRRQRRR